MRNRFKIRLMVEGAETDCPRCGRTAIVNDCGIYCPYCGWLQATTWWRSLIFRLLHHAKGQ